jgi:predicted TIM-barrel fold metal-dependent hydrolase
MGSGKDIFDNIAIGALAKKVPQCKIIMAHMRGPGFIEVLDSNPNVYLGTVKAELKVHLSLSSVTLKFLLNVEAFHFVLVKGVR